MKLNKKFLIIEILFPVIILPVLLLASVDLVVVFMIMGLVLLFIFFRLLFLKSLNRRFNRLAFKIEEMAAGNVFKKIQVRSKDEVCQVVSALNDLIERLGSGVAMDVSVSRELAQAKSDFVSLASHQLRTPLSIVKWYSDYLLSGDCGELKKEQKKYIKEIFISNQRMIDLVNALLDVSRIDLRTFAIEPEPTKIVKKAEEAIKKFKKEITKKKINFEKNFEKMPVLNLDPRLILIVFENILSNAIKYTPEGGKVRFIIRKTEANVLIKVSDTGVGIKRSDRHKMFTKMFRADNAKKMSAGGTGLGLYIAKAVIERSGGKIWYESPSLDFFVEKEKDKELKSMMKKGMGTTFFITIPLKGMKRKEGTKNLESIQ